MKNHQLLVRFVYSSIAAVTPAILTLIVSISFASILSACNPVAFQAAPNLSADSAPPIQDSTPTSGPVPLPVAQQTAEQVPEGKTAPDGTLPMDKAKIPVTVSSGGSPSTQPKSTQPKENRKSAPVPEVKTPAPAVTAPPAVAAPAVASREPTSLPLTPVSVSSEPTSAPEVTTEKAAPKAASKKTSPAPKAAVSTPAPAKKTTPAKKDAKHPAVVAQAPSVPVPLAVQNPARSSDRSRAVAGSGNCENGTRLLSCMACPAAPAQNMDPPLSAKGAALLDILERACSVPNGSDPAGYVAPTRAQLLARMNRLSSALYPDSQMSPLQSSTISSLRSASGDLAKIFGGVFYSGVTPATTAFETYFGISTIESRYSFCYTDGSVADVNGLGLTFTRSNSTRIHPGPSSPSSSFWSCVAEQDSNNCGESEDYVNANLYRNQLRRALDESVTNPYQPLASASPQTCQWAKLDTVMGNDVLAQVGNWIANGYVVGAEIASLRQCAQVRSVADIQNVPSDTPIAIAAYRCR